MKKMKQRYVISVITGITMLTLTLYFTYFNDNSTVQTGLLLFSFLNVIITKLRWMITYDKRFKDNKMFKIGLEGAFNSIPIYEYNEPELNFIMRNHYKWVIISLLVFFANAFHH